MTDAPAAAMTDVKDIIEIHEAPNGGATVLIASAFKSEADRLSRPLKCIGAYASIEALFADEEGLVFRGGSTFIANMLREGIQHMRLEVAYSEADAKVEGKPGRTVGLSMRETRYRDRPSAARLFDGVRPRALLNL